MELSDFILPTKPMKIGIVDADSAIYLLSWKMEALGYSWLNESQLASIPDIVYQYVNTWVEEIKAQMGVDKLQLHFTASSRNQTYFEERYNKPLQTQFRKLLTTYKANRGDTNPFLYTTILRAFGELYEIYLHDQWEADDTIVYLHKKYPEYVIASNDKDVHSQVVGTCYQYDKRKSVTGTSKEYANWFPYYQTITGDPTDGFYGIKGIGKVGAMRIVKPEMTPYEMWTAVVNAYLSNGMTEEDAILNMRMANMHQLTDSGIVLFQPPTEETQHVYQ